MILAHGGPLRFPMLAHGIGKILNTRKVAVCKVYVNVDDANNVDSIRLSICDVSWDDFVTFIVYSLMWPQIPHCTIIAVFQWMICCKHILKLDVLVNETSWIGKANMDLSLCNNKYGNVKANIKGRSPGETKILELKSTFNGILLWESVEILLWDVALIMLFCSEVGLFWVGKPAQTVWYLTDFVSLFVAV